MNNDNKNITNLYTKIFKEGLEDLHAGLQYHEDLPNDDSHLDSMVSDEFLDSVMESLPKPSMKLGLLLLYVGHNINDAYRLHPELKKIAAKTMIYENLVYANNVIKKMCSNLLHRNSKYVDNEDLIKLRVTTGVKLTDRLVAWARTKGLDYLVGNGNIRKHSF